jgi:hypothetical protein
VPLSFGQLAGFVALVAGTLIYNEIWVLPCEFLNKNTKAIRAARDVGGVLDEDAPAIGYMASSPAVYDSQRNKRNISVKLNERGKLLQNHKDEDPKLFINDLAASGVTDPEGRSTIASKYQ